MAEDKKFKFENGRFINRVSGEAIPDDEPVILFRARDRHAISVLLVYQNLISDDHHKAAVQERINDFTQFQIDHPERMKEPGITRHIRLDNVDHDALLRIQEILSGVSWNPVRSWTAATLNEIADVMNNAGYKIEDS